MRKAMSIRVRQLFRWSLRIFLALIATAVGLIVADSMHRRTCRAGDLRGQVIQWEGERLQILQTGQETNGQVLSMDTVREPFKDPITGCGASMGTFIRFRRNDSRSSLVAPAS